MRKPKEIEKEINEVSNRLHALRVELNDALTAPCGISVGQRVRLGNGREFEVTRLNGCWHGSVSVYGKPIRKNGTPANRVQYVGWAKEVEVIADAQS
jgi:hypothetical protein